MKKPTLSVFTIIYFAIFLNVVCSPDDTILNSRKDPSLKKDSPKIEKEAYSGDSERFLMVYIPAGEFIMGSDEDVRDVKHKVYLDAYYIDKFEVTVDKYMKCVRARKCRKPCRDSGNVTKIPSNWVFPNRGNHPVNCVSWENAEDYCKWAGKRLPTEAEWEKAARGTDERKYPWGSEELNCDYAVMNDASSGRGHKSDGCSRKSTWPVGSKPNGASPYGALDIAGNVAEWVEDWYCDYKDSPAKNPRGYCSLDGYKGPVRVVRGGSWLDKHDLYLASYGRMAVHLDAAGYTIGFRCAKSAE